MGSQQYLEKNGKLRWMERRKVREPGGLSPRLGWPLLGTDPQMPYHHSGPHHHQENGRIVRFVKSRSPLTFEDSYIVFFTCKTFVIFEISTDPVVSLVYLL